MNKVFRIIWSKVREKWIVVSEKVTVKGAGPAAAIGSLAAAALLAVAGSAYAIDTGTLPTGGKITAGQGSIVTSGSNMAVNQTSQQLIANWNTFNIGVNAGVQFNQPNSAATAFNRISDQNPSQILGSLTANGKVFLINPSGIIFGQNAQVNVGGLVASSLGMLDSDFLAGRYKFSNSGSAGSIINQGNITAAPGGVVALIAPRVANEGTITASGGSVALAAGNQVTLDFSGDGLINLAIDEGIINAQVANSGLIRVDNGMAIMSARSANTISAAAINNSGVIEAKGLTSSGGKIVLTGDDITLASGSKLDASGATGGGTVLVGGDWQGSGAMHQATTVTMEQGAKIDASATQQGNGGKVVLWSDVTNAASHTIVAGSIKAEGAGGGAGGTVETSGHKLSIFDSASVKTGGGQWLLDPYDFTIGAGGDITATNLQTALASGNVSITTQTTGTNTSSAYYGASGTAGDIIIKDALSWSANTLSLTANHSVLVNNVVSVSGTAGLTVLTNQGSYTGINVGYLKTKQNRSGTNGTDTFDGKIDWTSTGIFSLEGISYTTTGNGKGTDATTNAGKIITTEAELKAIAALDPTVAANARYYLLGADLTLTNLPTKTYTWVPLSDVSVSPYLGFRGVFDGLGHAVSNLKNDPASTAARNGMFGYSYMATISNLGLVSSAISGGTNVGLISGYAISSNFRNLFTSADSEVVIGSYTGGGLIGYSLSGFQVLDSYNAAAVYSTTAAISQVGGILGYTDGGVGEFTAARSFNVGTITAGLLANQGTSTLGGNVAGVLAYVWFDGSTTAFNISNLKNYGAVYGSSNVGGISGAWVNNGYSNAMTVTGLANTSSGAISGNYAVGGIFGFLQTNAGNPSHFDLSNLTNAATVTGVGANNQSIGGIMGQAYSNYYQTKYITLDTAFNTGNVTGIDKVGGIVGSGFGTSSYQGKLTLTNVYNTGNITATGNTTNATAGGIIGFSQFQDFLTITNAYNSGYVVSNETTNIRVGGIIGYYQPNNPADSMSLSNVYSLSGNVVNDQLAGTIFATEHITSRTGITSISPATFQANTLTTDGFAASGKWGGGSGTMPYLLGFTVPLSYTLSNVNSGYTYDGNAVNFTNLWSATSIFGASYSSWVLGTDYVFKYGGNTVASETNAGTYSNISVSILNSNYSVSSGTTGSLTINPKTVTITGSKTYDGNATTSGASLSVSNLAGSDTVTVTNSGTAAIASRNVGNQTLSNMTGLSLSNTNYTLTGATGSITVNARPITISTTNVTKTYDAGLIASGSATAISGTSLGTGDSFSGGTYAFTDANAGSGNKTVAVSGVTVSDGNGGNNYTVTLVNNTTSTINKATLTVSGSKTYDGSTSMLGYLTLGGFVGTETVDYSAATVSDPHVATANKYINSITLTNGINGGAASNYQIPAGYNASTNHVTISAATLTPTISNSGVTKQYDGNTSTTLTPTYTFSGLVGSDTNATLTNTGKVYNSKDVATASQITVSGLGISGITGGGAVSDYVLDSSSKTVAATITAAPITVTAVNINDKVYDGTTTATGVQSTTFTGRQGSDDVNVSGTLGSFSSANVGSYSVSITGTTLTGTQASNYYLTGGTTFTDPAVAITPKTVILSGAKTYDGTTGLNGFVTIDTGVLSETLTYTGATASNAHVATSGKFINAIALANGTNGGLATNYQLPTLNAANAPVTITTATLTPTISNTGVTKIYDGNTSTTLTPTYTFAGLVAGDTNATLTNTSKVYNSKDVTTANQITVSGLAISGITGGNGSLASDYALDSTSKTVAGTITQKTLTVTGLSASDKVYDGDTSVTISNWGSVNSGVGAETLTLNHGTASFADKNVADGIVVTASGYALADGSNGGLASNYQLSSTDAATTANITPKTVTISATKTYDSTIGLNGFVTIDTGVLSETLTYTGATASDAHVVTSGKFINAIALTDGSNGGLATNYQLPTLNAVNAPVTITAATLTPTISNTGVTKVYDGNTSTTLAPTYTFAGLVAGDTNATLTNTGKDYNSKDVVTANQITVSGLAISSVTGGNGSLASDYALDSTSKTVAGTITPKTLTLASVTAADKSFTGTTDATLTVGSLIGLVGSEALNSNTTGVFSDANAGIAKTVTVHTVLNDASGLASNYTIADSTSTATINPLPPPPPPVPVAPSTPQSSADPTSGSGSTGGTDTDTGGGTGSGTDTSGGSTSGTGGTTSGSGGDTSGGSTDGSTSGGTTGTGTDTSGGSTSGSGSTGSGTDTSGGSTSSGTTSGSGGDTSEGSTGGSTSGGTSGGSSTGTDASGGSTSGSGSTGSGTDTSGGSTSGTGGTTSGSGGDTSGGSTDGSTSGGTNGTGTDTSGGSTSGSGGSTSGGSTSGTGTDTSGSGNGTGGTETATGGMASGSNGSGTDTNGGSTSGGSTGGTGTGSGGDTSSGSTTGTSTGSGTDTNSGNTSGSTTGSGSGTGTDTSGGSTSGGTNGSNPSGTDTSSGGSTSGSGSTGASTTGGSTSGTGTDTTGGTGTATGGTTSGNGSSGTDTSGSSTSGSGGGTSGGSTGGSTGNGSGSSTDTSGGSTSGTGSSTSDGSTGNGAGTGSGSDTSGGNGGSASGRTSAGNSADSHSIIINTRGTEGELLNYTIPASDIAKLAGAVNNTAVATMRNGSPLPEWLHFDRDSLTFIATKVPPRALPLAVTIEFSGKNGAKYSILLTIQK